MTSFRTFNLLIVYLVASIAATTQVGHAQVTIRVPADHATITDALAAANAGDTILIENSATYVEPLLNIDKTINIEAAPGENPTIQFNSTPNSSMFYMNENSGGSRIGSNAGGQIIVDGNGSCQILIRLINAPDTEVTFENLYLQNTHPSLGKAVYSINTLGSVGSAAFYNCVFDMGTRGDRTVQLEFHSPDATIAFDHCEWLNTGDGPNQDCILLSVNDTNNHGGHLVLKNCYLEGGWRTIYVFQAFDKPRWSVDIQDSLLVCKGASDGGINLVNFQTGTEMRISGSAFVADLINLQMPGQLSGGNDANSSLSVDHCDLVSEGGSNLQIEPNTGRTVSLTNSILWTQASAPNVFSRESTGESFSASHNNVFGPGQAYENFPPGTADVTPPEEPAYPDYLGGNFIYTNANFLNADETGGPIGSYRNFAEDDNGGGGEPTPTSHWTIYL